LTTKKYIWEESKKSDFFLNLTFFAFGNKWFIRGGGYWPGGLGMA